MHRKSLKVRMESHMMIPKKFWLVPLTALIVISFSGCGVVALTEPTETVDPNATEVAEASTATPIMADGVGGGDSQTDDTDIQLTLAVVEMTLTALGNITPTVVTEEVVITATDDATATPTPSPTVPGVQLTRLAGTLAALTEVPKTLTAIVVSSTPTPVTPSPSPEPQQLTATAENLPSPTITTTSIPCNSMNFVYDDTIADGTRVDPGEVFTKRWRVQNDGACTWQAGKYALVFFDGDRLNGSTPLPLQFSIPPGGYMNLSVVLTAPYAPGPYRGYWMLADGEGNLFGYGPNNTQAFWVDIVVRGEVPTVPVVDFATVTPSP
jgi:hypothetical protein